MRVSLRHWLLLSVVCVLLGGYRPAALAQPGQTPASQYGGLDIIFLVDQSGSMGGATYGYEGEGTDPLDLRFRAIDYAIQALGQYRLTLAPDVPMRIAVINFGDEASLDDISRGWTAIAPSGDEAQWEATYQNLSDQLSAEAFRQRSTDDVDYLGNTNFLDAFQAADLMFGQLSTAGNLPHLRAVVLLTDGAPCVPTSFDCNDPAGRVNHMNAVQTLVSNEFSDEQYTVYVIGLDAGNDYWSIWADDWQTITGDADRARRAETNQQVGVRLYNIIIDLVNRIRNTSVVDSRTLQPGTNMIFLPPYLSEARFSIFKSDTSPGVLEINRPDGQPLAPDAPELTVRGQNSPIEIWTVNDPVPGEWVITVGSTDDRIDVYLELIPVEVQATLTGGPYIQSTSLDLLFELAGADGTPLLILDDPYTLNVSMTVTRPDGTTLTDTLQQEPGSRFRGTFLAEQSGVHTVSLSATTPVLNDTTYTVLEGRQVASFEVLDLQFQPDNLPTGEYLVGEAVPVAVTLTDQDGTPFTADDINVTAVVTVDANQTTYPLTYRADTGQYSFSLPLDRAGNYRLRVRAVSSGAASGEALARTSEVPFVVLESQSVALQARTPEENPASRWTHEGYLPPQRQNLVITVETVLVDENRPIALESLLTSAANPWSYTVLREGEPYTATDVSFRSTDAPGRYQLEITEPPAGEYTVTIRAGGTLQGTYFLTQDSVSRTINVQRNWLPEILIALGGVAVLLLIALGVRIMRRRAELSKHPARGRLELREQESGHAVWTYNLDSQKRNYLEIKDRKLRKYGIQAIIVECPDKRYWRDRKIRVTVEMDSDRRLTGRTLSPGRRLNLSGGGLRGSSDTDQRYELVKDPNQLPLM